MRLVLTAVTAVVLTVIFSALYLLTIPFDKRNRAFSFFAYHWSKAILCVTGIRVKVTGLEKIDLSRPHVFVSNHASLFDITAIIVGVNRYVRFIAKKEIARVPVFGWAVSHAHIMIDRKRPTDSVRSLQKASRQIALGDSVILFAEGTRTRDGNLLPFKRGAFLLAIEAGVPIVPLTILGSFNIMKRGSLNLKRGVIRILVDEPIDVNNYRGKQGVVELMNLVRGIIERNYAGSTPLNEEKQ
ncbi:MAG: lysophospholipid acyltransferase family protein [Candidatus Kryptoniota bacterium]